MKSGLRVPWVRVGAKDGECEAGSALSQSRAFIRIQNNATTCPPNQAQATLVSVKCANMIDDFTTSVLTDWSSCRFRAQVALLESATL